MVEIGCIERALPFLRFQSGGEFVSICVLRAIWPVALALTRSDRWGIDRLPAVCSMFRRERIMPSGSHEPRAHSKAQAARFAAAECPEALWDARWQANRSRQFRILGYLLALGFLATTVDISVAQRLVHGQWLHKLHRFLGSFEPFGQPTAILMTAAAIALCDVRRRPLMPRLLAAALGSGLAADVVKLAIARTRPRHHDLADSVWSTFQGFFPGPWAGSALQSCPSAHTATAVGFALALGTLFPPGRWLFFPAAGLVALQRIEAGAHFVSDTLWGAVVGYAVCLVLFRADLAGAWFDRRERLWSGDRNEPATPIRERLSIVPRDDESSPTDDFSG
jgi:membrane-associated phospholipid phosphatase